MLLRRMAPMATFGPIGREFERLFNGFWNDADSPTGQPRAFPPLNVWEENDDFVVEAEVPGLQMQNIDVEVLGNELTVKGRREPVAQENVTYHRQERGHGEFTRVLTLPVDVNPEKVQATLRDGVLTIRLPKAEAAKARKIQVKSLE